MTEPRTIAPTENRLLIAAMQAAEELNQIYNSGLSTRAIQGRMHRIAEDLKTAADDGADFPVTGDHIKKDKGK